MSEGNGRSRHKILRPLRFAWYISTRDIRMYILCTSLTRKLRDARLSIKGISWHHNLNGFECKYTCWEQRRRPNMPFCSSYICRLGPDFFGPKNLGRWMEIWEDHLGPESDLRKKGDIYVIHAMIYNFNFNHTHQYPDTYEWTRVQHKYPMQNCESTASMVSYASVILLW